MAPKSPKKAGKSKALRVAVFTDTYHPQINGLVTSIDSNREELGKRGHKLTIFAPNIPGAKATSTVKLLGGFVFPPQPEYTFVLPWGKGYSLRGLARDSFDLVHSHATWGAGFVARLMARRWKRPLVLTYHTMWELYAHYSPLAKFGVPISAQMPFFRAVTRFLCNPCDTVIAPTAAIEAQLRRYGVKAHVEVLPTGLTGDAYRRNPKAKAKTRRRWKLPAKGFVIASAGRLGPEKNWDVLMKAVASRAELKEVHLAIAGDGPDRQPLGRLAAELGIADRVTFTGYVSRTQVLELFECADLFAFASVTETQGMVILEAMARGCAVVAVDALGPGEILKGQKAGWLAKPGNIASLAKALVEAKKSPAKRRAKARAGEALAKRYSAKAINARLEKIYQGVVRRAGGAA